MSKVSDHTSNGNDAKRTFDSLAAESLYKSLGQTAQARFEAHRRLMARDHKNNRLVAVASSTVIVLTILPYLFSREGQWVDVFAFVSIAMALAILVSSLLHYSRVDAANAEQLHRSALEINEIRREMAVFQPSISQAKLLNFIKKYDSVLQKYSVNHDRIDIETVMSERPEDYPWISRRDRIIFGVKKFVQGVGPDIVSMATILFVISIAVAFYLSPTIDSGMPS